MDTLTLIQQWRAACAQHGIDPVEGATGYQVASMLAAQSKATHTHRMADLVKRHAALHPLNYDDGYGMIDTVKVERQRRRVWWVYVDYWPRLRGDEDVVNRPTEIQAVRNIRSDAQYRMGHETDEQVRHRRRQQQADYSKKLFREVVREVLSEQKAEAFALSIG